MKMIHRHKHLTTIRRERSIMRDSHPASYNNFGEAHASSLFLFTCSETESGKYLSCFLNKWSTFSSC